MVICLVGIFLLRGPPGKTWESPPSPHPIIFSLSTLRLYELAHAKGEKQTLKFHECAAENDP